MDILKLISDLLAEKETATNKDKMGVVLDKALAALKKIYETPADEQTAAVISGFKTQLFEKDITITNLTKERDDANDIAKDALAKFNESSESASEALIAKVKGEKVQINYGVNYKGVNYSATDLQNNPDILSELLELGSGAVNLKEDN